MAPKNDAHKTAPARTLCALACLLFASLPLFSAEAAPADAASNFRAWFKKYKKGEINLYQLSSVPLAGDEGAKFKYYKQDKLQEMDSLLQGLAEKNDLEATQLLVEAATFQFHRKPDVEIEKFFEEQPWLLRSHALDALKKIDDPESVKWLRQRCLECNSGWDCPLRKVIALSLFGENHALEDPSLLLGLLDDRDLRVRIEALEGLGRVGGLDELAMAIDKINDAEPLVRVAAIEAAGEILARSREPARTEASALIPAITKHFDDPEWPVQETILSMMERFRSRDSIPILIEFLEKITSRPKEYRERILQRVLEVLRSLTGAQMQEADPGKWRAWWAEHEEGFQMAPAPPPVLRGFQLDGPAFFNIPVNSDCVYFILDVSGSMKAPLPSQESGAPEEAPSKLDRAREELNKTLSDLAPDVYFNIILFNETVRMFSERPVQATEEAKKAAALFFQEAHADEGTNIFDSLNRALEIKNIGLVNRIGDKVELDTVFLLSDGVPTTGAVIDPAEILRIITQANRLTKIKINTVYLGRDPSPFMRELAENNFGHYIQVQ